jgi:hypothetical protein
VESNASPQPFPEEAFDYLASAESRHWWFLSRNQIITWVLKAKVRRLEIKSRLGMELSTEELETIDPTIPGGAFETSKILSDRIDEKKAVEVAIEETKKIG